MEESLGLSLSSSSDPSSSKNMETSDEENDPALLDLIAQRKRLVAALAEEGELGANSPCSMDNAHCDGAGDTMESEYPPDAASLDTTDPAGMDTLDDTDVAMDAGTAEEEMDEDPESSDEEFDDEVDKMLEESLANGASAPASSASTADEKFSGLSQPPAVKSKIVLKRRGMEYFEVLPDGWIEVTHSSGIPVFLHKSTRVCTLSRPYFIGPGSVRNHDVPMSAVPCYYQRKMKEMVAAKEKTEQATENGSNVDGFDASDDKMANMPKVKVQTVDDFKERNLTPDQLHTYCTNAFEFETISVMRFKSWADHRAYRRRQKQHPQMNSTPVTGAQPACPMANGCDATGRPSLPANVKLITVPDMEKGSKPQQKPFFMNPQGRTSIAVLHEYVQKVMKGNVSYEFTETRNAANPYCAVVRIATHDRQRASAVSSQNEGGANESGKGTGEMVWAEYGKGEGNSKKNAKLNAAKQALRVLVPGIEFNADGVADLPPQDDAGKLFDLIKISDSRVPELSAKAGQPTPFVILQECLKRHSSFGDTTIDVGIKRLKHQQHEFTMKVAKHEVKVQCTNKKEGKQRAAQAMLEKLHPQITTWGSLIRLYGYGAQRKMQETRKEKDSIIRLQSQNKQHQTGDEPNIAILEKLKQEMQKLYEQRTMVDNSQCSSGIAASAVKNIDI